MTQFMSPLEWLDNFFGEFSGEMKYLYRVNICTFYLVINFSKVVPKRIILAQHVSDTKEHEGSEGKHF